MMYRLRSLRGVGQASGSGLGERLIARKHKEAAELSGLTTKVSAVVKDKSIAERRFERLFK
jgi:hypothetical protein